MSGNLPLAGAIASAQSRCTLEPVDGWRHVDGRATPYTGWRVSFLDLRSWPASRSLVLYDSEVNREIVRAVIASWFAEAAR